MDAVIKKNNNNLINLMSPFWNPHLALMVLDWLKIKTAYPLPEIEEHQSKLLATLALEDPKKAENLEKIEEIKKSLIPFKAALTAYELDQQNRISGNIERISIIELSDWWVAKKPTTLKSYSDEEKARIHLEYTEFPKTIEEKYPILAKLYFDIGDYEKSKEVLNYFLNTVVEITIEANTVSKISSCLWGLACCGILANSTEVPAEPVSPTNQPLTSQTNEKESSNATEESKEQLVKPQTNENEIAVECLLRIGDFVETNKSATREVSLLQRAWLLHWLMWPMFRYFLYLTHTKKVQVRSQQWSVLPDWLVLEKNMAVVYLIAPHLLRYYAVYIILTKNRKDHLQTIINAIENSKSKYSDSFTLLIEALFIHFDLDAAQHNITEIGKLCDNDYFLEGLKSAIEDHSRLLIFETFCRIHKSINLEMIAKKVNMTPESAERWIVNLIRHAKLEARIDSEKNRIEMAATPPNLYQQVIEKTRNLVIRSNLLIQNLNRPISQKEDEGSNMQRGNRMRGGGGQRSWNRGGGQGHGQGRPNVGGGGGGRRLAEI